MKKYIESQNEGFYGVIKKKNYFWDKDFNLIDGHHRYDIIRRMEPAMTSVRVLQLGISYQTVIDLFKNIS